MTSNLRKWFYSNFCYRFSPKGTVLIITSLIMGVLLLLGIYFLSFTLVESKIARSQAAGVQSYYLAEAGINKAIWKLKNEEPWKTCFATTSVAYGCDCNNWQDSFTVNAMNNSTTTVSVQNSVCAKGSIMATSTLMTQDKKIAQRVVKTTAYKALAGPTQGAAIFSGGTSEDINISLSQLKIYGSLFSNNNLIINLLSNVEVYATSSGLSKILAVQNYNKSWNSTVSSLADCAKNICQSTTTCGCIDMEKFSDCQESKCPPKAVLSPSVDFDSTSTLSFKSRAQTDENNGLCQNSCNGGSCLCNGNPCSGSNKCVLSAAEFEDLLWAAGQDGVLTLGSPAIPQIVYVTGSIDIKGGIAVQINGTLVADATINVGEYSKWTRGGQKYEGFSQVTINRPLATTTSGLLTKSKINFGSYSSVSTTTIVGVIYASDEIKLTSLPQGFEITGGIIARKLSFTSIFSPLIFILDDDVLLYGLGYVINGFATNPAYSPVITIEHWEEEY